jgi:hypothetical protein
MSLFGPNNFLNMSSVKEDSINLALYILNMSKSEYNSLSKDDLLERKKQSLMVSSHVSSALNILVHYKTNDIIEDLSPLKIPHQPITKKPKFKDFIEPSFGPNFDPHFDPHLDSYLNQQSEPKFK